jgi:hypothetical protein
MKQYAIKIKVYLDGDEICSASTISSPMLDSVITDAEEQLGKIQSGIDKKVAYQEQVDEYNRTRQYD